MSPISGKWSVFALNSLPWYKILHVLASCHVKKSAHERGDARPEKLNLSALCSSSSQPKLSLTSRPPFPYWRYVRSRGVPASEITWSPLSGIFQGPTLGTRSAPTDRLVARGHVKSVGAGSKHRLARGRRGFRLRPGSMTAAGWEASSCTAVRRAEQASEYPCS